MKPNSWWPDASTRSRMRLLCACANKGSAVCWLLSPVYEKIKKGIYFFHICMRLMSWHRCQTAWAPSGFPSRSKAGKRERAVQYHSHYSQAGDIILWPFCPGILSASVSASGFPFPRKPKEWDISWPRLVKHWHLAVTTAKRTLPAELTLQFPFFLFPRVFLAEMDLKWVIDKIIFVDWITGSVYVCVFFCSNVMLSHFFRGFKDYLANR